eukprot:TRINITY_DN6854_c0_g1_i1.p1 TRINITY_DN6854_c0_g1~~TRINITY_DN6854_c0_g1_i1.p1  ORF type:complete len:548 (+),score=223.69 TRINITY_DN6854_c0_g1_i1:122-1765(+)
MLRSLCSSTAVRACTARVLHRRFSSVPPWATLDPAALSAQSPARLQNLVGGRWADVERTHDVIDPLNGEVILHMPDTQEHELGPFLESMRRVPKSGLHNPLRNPERYQLYGEVCKKAAAAIEQPEVEDFFTRAIQRVVPKSDQQARNEVVVTRRFLENFASDNARFCARGFSVAGDHTGQMSHGMRWPFGPVALITPFNFPFEIPVLQLMGALIMGNKPLLKVCERVSMVMEQYVRLLEHVGMPPQDLDLIHGKGRVVQRLLEQVPVRVTQFTGSSAVAEKLSRDLAGKVRVEDAGFDWKLLGPDVQHEEYVAWQCDQDAYGASGQKCSAQSILFVHENWARTPLLERLERLAGRRKLSDLTIGPVLTQTTKGMLEHTQRLLSIPGARLLFGGRELADHTIPEVYGAIEPTAVFVPLEQLVSDEHFGACTTEIFGPFQVVTEYKGEELPTVLSALERMEHHLTAAVVSNDRPFVNHVLGHTVNGTQYAGIRARTTGAPQNHWFGPAGDPRGAGIGTPEAIRLVWSCHREVVMDEGPIDPEWTTPPPS